MIPPGVSNLALLGQYCEIPDDIVFTLEYSVRSAQTAVYSRLGLRRKVSPVYKGYRNPRHVYKAIMAVFGRNTGAPADARETLPRPSLGAGLEQGPAN